MKFPCNVVVCFDTQDIGWYAHWGEGKEPQPLYLGSVLKCPVFSARFPSYDGRQLFKTRDQAREALHLYAKINHLGIDLLLVGKDCDLWVLKEGRLLDLEAVDEALNFSTS